jgi:hypothetical protein
MTQDTPPEEDGASDEVLLNRLTVAWQKREMEAIKALLRRVLDRWPINSQMMEEIEPRDLLVVAAAIQFIYPPMHFNTGLARLMLLASTHRLSERGDSEVIIEVGTTLISRLMEVDEDEYRVRYVINIFDTCIPDDHPLFSQLCDRFYETYRPSNVAEFRPR